MAVVSILLGGVAGFFSALIGMITLNISWLMALGLWSGVGTAVAAVILLIALAPGSVTLARRQTRDA
jgi:formate-dependent nitrite reductase membrane component NrfD